jgi:hypothetical protein
MSHESIYQAIYRPGSALIRTSRLAPQRRSPFRTGRDHRRAERRTDRRRPRFEQPMLSVHQRPFSPDDRGEAGHWEGDLIIGTNQQSAIGTLVERQTRLVRLLYLPQRDGDSLHEALTARLGGLPQTSRVHLPGTRADPSAGRSRTRVAAEELARYRVVVAVWRYWRPVSGSMYVPARAKRAASGESNGLRSRHRCRSFVGDPRVL